MVVQCGLITMGFRLTNGPIDYDSRWRSAHPEVGGAISLRDLGIAIGRVAHTAAEFFYRRSDRLVAAIAAGTLVVILAKGVGADLKQTGTDMSHTLNKECAGSMPSADLFGIDGHDDATRPVICAFFDPGAGTDIDSDLGTSQRGDVAAVISGAGNS